MRGFLLAAFLVLTAGPVSAFGVGEGLPDAAEEARARSLFHELRCMVCQNQSIADSDAPLAKDLRELVRERVSAGDSETEIKSFLVARYGDFVLLRPPLDASTLLLWGAPAIVLLLGAGATLMAFRRRGGAPTELSADEERRLRRALGGGD
jgi:cytochrome c-type biogenesis protein CcmH